VSGDAHRLAVKALEQSLGLTHPGESSVLDYRLGRAQAFVDLGVIDVEAMHDWKERLERAAQALEPVSAESRARAVELPRELARAESASESFDPLGPRESFLTKLQALLEIGHIEWRDRSAWVESSTRSHPRHRRVLGPRPMTQRSFGRSSSVRSAGSVGFGSPRRRSMTTV